MQAFRLLTAIAGLALAQVGLSDLQAQVRPASASSSSAKSPSVRYSFSDEGSEQGSSAGGVELHLSEPGLSEPGLSEANFSEHNSNEMVGEGLPREYPDYVSKDPGHPRKPLWERPGDFNGSQFMDPRYCQDDDFRAGWPKCVRKRAICSLNDHYYAWYVGGGAGLPFLKNRYRTAEEGTWGLDYSLWKKPRTVWMKWTCGRYQGGEGAYATDHHPLFE